MGSESRDNGYLRVEQARGKQGRIRGRGGTDCGGTEEALFKRMLAKTIYPELEQSCASPATPAERLARGSNESHAQRVSPRLGRVWGCVACAASSPAVAPALGASAEP
eukprot:1954473-Rhodomonas_salina.1